MALLPMLKMSPLNETWNYVDVCRSLGLSLKQIKKVFLLSLLEWIREGDISVAINLQAEVLHRPGVDLRADTGILYLKPQRDLTKKTYEVCRLALTAVRYCFPSLTCLGKGGRLKTNIGNGGLSPSPFTPNLFLPRWPHYLSIR